MSLFMIFGQDDIPVAWDEVDLTSGVLDFKIENGIAEATITCHAHADGLAVRWVLYGYASGTYDNHSYVRQGDALTSRIRFEAHSTV
jgi:hypothetical protein